MKQDTDKKRDLGIFLYFAQGNLCGDFSAETKRTLVGCNVFSIG